MIVAGGITNFNLQTRAKAVEVFHISLHTKSHWSIVEQLPLAVCKAIPLVIDDKIYISQGFDNMANTYNVLTASLPELLQSRNKNTSSSQVWYKLPDMPYSSFSINHYQGHLITFSGNYKNEHPDEGIPVCQSVPLIHIYSPNIKTWDCVGEIPHGYLLGRSVHIKENKILFIGGLTDKHHLNKDDNIITASSILTISPCID